MKKFFKSKGFWIGLEIFMFVFSILMPIQNIIMGLDFLVNPENGIFLDGGSVDTVWVQLVISALSLAFIAVLFVFSLKYTLSKFKNKKGDENEG